jgi:hypothetical protein
MPTFAPAIVDLAYDKRHLLIVPLGSFFLFLLFILLFSSFLPPFRTDGLPFHPRVTEPPSTSRPNSRQLQAYRDAAWLIQHHALTVLPSVSNLRALRVLAKGGQAAKPIAW